MNYSSRFWLYAPLGSFLALAAWVMVHWWTMAAAFDKKLEAIKSHEAIPGIVIDWRSKTLSGFPFRLDLVFQDLSLKGAGAHGPFDWRSEQFALHTLTYGRNKQVFEASGSQSLSWTGKDGRRHETAFLPAAFHASAICDAGGLARFDLDILDVGSKDFTAGRLQLHMRRDLRKDGLDLAASADAIKGVAGAESSGTRIRSLRLSGKLNHAASFAPLLRGESSWPQADAAWHAAGGRVKLDTADLTSGQIAALERLLAALY